MKRNPRKYQATKTKKVTAMEEKQQPKPSRAYTTRRNPHKTYGKDKSRQYDKMLLEMRKDLKDKGFGYHLINFRLTSVGHALVYLVIINHPSVSVVKVASILGEYLKRPMEKKVYIHFCFSYNPAEYGQDKEVASLPVLTNK